MKIKELKRLGFIFQNENERIILSFEGEIIGNYCPQDDIDPDFFLNFWEIAKCAKINEIKNALEL